MTHHTITSNNGVDLPALGFGVFRTPPGVTTDAVAEAPRAGYRNVDTAAAYGNEREVREGIRRSGVAREEVFVRTKIWISDYGYDTTPHSFDKSAGKRGMDQLDLPPPPHRLPCTPDPRHPSAVRRSTLDRTRRQNYPI
ncbi:aldo/keto reductase [Streptomyces sp. NPDC091387]|uniref:aldo/keto reductase n=1 Tax=Streptomyces sp. NPDC091387 TaxID=3365998 RepID=UPI00380A26EE